MSHVVKYLLHLWLYFTTTTPIHEFFFTYLRWGYTYNITEAYPKSAALNAKREKLGGN